MPPISHLYKSGNPKSTNHGYYSHFLTYYRHRCQDESPSLLCLVLRRRLCPLQSRSKFG
jgi:hypothetical protein